MLFISCSLALGSQCEGDFWRNTDKPIFHQKLGSCWLLNSNEIETKNMKCTWPMREICIWDPMQLALGFCVGGNANFVFLNTISCWGSKPMQGPNANIFASQWNIGCTFQNQKFPKISSIREPRNLKEHYVMG